MSERMTCPRCGGTVAIPGAPASNVTCPFCKMFLMGVDPRTGATWTARKLAPRWLLHAGLLLILVGQAGFWRDLLVVDKRGWHSATEPISAGAKNPLFLGATSIGLWLSTRRRQPAD